MKIKEILDVIEQLAPLPLQEGFDNSGVQLGEVNQTVRSVLLSIDVTEVVIDEAISLGCNLIISHHPIAFKPMKSLTGKNYVERCIMKACKHEIVLYAAHTNLDNAIGGINFKLAEKLGLQNVRILSPANNLLQKLVTFVPSLHAQSVRTALFNAGAGHIGNYDSCSYNLQGTGTFRALEEAKPYCGEKNKLHLEEEIRMEVIIPVYRQREVISALLAVHPYEEPAYDIYTLENKWDRAGSGVVGSLLEPMDEEAFLYLLKDTFLLNNLQHSAFREKEIKDVAICGGSGAFLIPNAISYGADIFITGEAKYNDFYDVEDKIMLATIGHYESEVCSKEIFYKLLTSKFINLDIQLSSFDVNPINYL